MDKGKEDTIYKTLKVLIIPSSSTTAPVSCNHLVVNRVCVLCGKVFKHPTDNTTIVT